MRISEIFDAPLNSYCDVNGVIQSKSLRSYGANSTQYLTILLGDSDAVIEFPVWKKVEERNEKLKQGDLIRVIGAVGEYQGKRQINPEGFEVLDPMKEDMSLYIAKYDIPESMWECFGRIVAALDQPYQRFVRAAIGYQDGGEVYQSAEERERWKDFTTCVAASKHHQNKQGGLFVHTFGVLTMIDCIIQNYCYCDSALIGCTDASSVINPSRLRAKAILHDICKTKEYEFKTGIYRKNVLMDHRFTFISFSDDINDSLGADGLDAEQLRDLQQSVLSHHGIWGVPRPKTLEDTLLHFSDAIDAKIAGCAQANDATAGIDFSIISILGAMERI